MRSLKPTKLHELLYQQTEWTDQLWNEALRFVLDNTVTDDAFVMLSAIGGGKPVGSIHKIDFLKQFRAHPPPMMLARFDTLRTTKRDRAA